MAQRQAQTVTSQKGVLFNNRLGVLDAALRQLRRAGGEQRENDRRDKKANAHRECQKVGNRPLAYSTPVVMVYRRAPYDGERARRRAGRRPGVRDSAGLDQRTRREAKQLMPYLCEQRIVSNALANGSNIRELRLDLGIIVFEPSAEDRTVERERGLERRLVFHIEHDTGKPIASRAIGRDVARHSKQAQERAATRFFSAFDVRAKIGF